MQKDRLIKNISDSFTKIENLISTNNELFWAEKEDPEKWSKKEILGHLIDSAINNIKRFTESQFKEKPYAVYGYAQNELVIANAYQQKQTEELFKLWKELNKQVIHLIHIQTQQTLNYKITISSTNEIKTLAWLMEDYVDHLLHHLEQIPAHE